MDKKLDDIPDGLIAVQVEKGCLLLLTEREYEAGIRRGKIYRRRVDLAKRETRRSE